LPVSLYIYWTQSRRPGPRSATRLRLAIAGVLAVAALGLALLYPVPRAELPSQAPLVAASNGAGTDATARPVGDAMLEAAADGGLALKVSVKDTADTSLPLPAKGARHERHEGIEASAWAVNSTNAPANAPSTLTLDDVVALSGGRIPVGLSPSRNPGPFSADWTVHRTTEIWAAHGLLLDATERDATVVTLSGGGLQTPRTLTVRDGGNGAGPGWQVSADYRDAAVKALNGVAMARTERQLWAVQLPVVLAIIALLLAASAGRMLMRQRRAPGTAETTSISKTGRRADSPIVKGVTNAAH